MGWEAAGVIVSILTLWVSILGLGVPMLAKLSACVVQLAELKERWTECRAADHAAHEVMVEQLEDHEERITDLEGVDEDWIGEIHGEEEDGRQDDPPAAA